ncbi:hypothetical protein [Haloferax sp. ATB1]|uniref:hypothetical protein n=1 Tax=Haloferax sp. ATB1 TaxID=1508454 RepID=UPI000B1B93C5|nr:hypothetical protein [Haloferax sp. ATB1]
MPNVPLIREFGISPFYQGAIITGIVFLIVIVVWRKLRQTISGENSPTNEFTRIQQNLRKGWLRKGVILAYGAIFVAFVVAVLEWNHTIDLVPSEGENQLTLMAPVFGAFGSIALSFGLVILYDRQARVLAQQYQPHLTGDLENRSAVTTQFVIRNTGEDYAHDITAEWEVAGETREWETPNLAPGDTAAFPVVVDDDGGWVMNTNQIRDYLEDNGDSLEIEFTINCKDQMDLAHTFSGTVDFGVMSQRQEAKEIWEMDPVDSLASSAESIEASIDQIASDFDDRRNEHQWQDRWTKQQAIKTIVSETGEIPISVLSRIIKENESSLEYRLSELEKAGYLEYNERSGVIRNKPNSKNNHTLSEFP